LRFDGSDILQNVESLIPSPESLTMLARVLLFCVLLTATAILRGQQPAPGPRTAQGQPNVLLVTLDTTRADRMGFLGSTRGLTPSLDALARDAVVFTRAYSQAPITTVSHATILTGTFPPLHKVNDFGSPLPAGVPYLADLFKAQGYRTGAFVGSLILDPKSGTAPGFDRGFDVYDAGYRLRRPGEDRFQTIERRGDEVVARATRWISESQIPNPKSPWFVWVHLYDAHDPYDPPADLKQKFATAAYDGEIAGVDRAVGRLLQSAPGAIVAVTADHGEALGDHQEETHGVFLYDAVLHVPLAIRLPDRRGAAHRVTTRVRLADVAPTMVEAAGLRVPSAMQGESLIPLVEAKANGKTEDRPVYSETEYPRRAFGWSPLTSWRNDRFLMIRAPTPELYDLVTDPGATRNLADTRGRVVEGMDAELRQFEERVGGGSAESRARPAVDPALAERLAALGYVSGGGATERAGVDPKSRIAVANALHNAVVAVEDGAFARAIPLLEQVVASDPDIPLAQLNLGVARARQRQYRQAIAPLKKTITLQPDQMFAHYELGVALYETGDLKTAAGHLEIVASRMPKWTDARYSLGSVYARIDRVPDAVTELRAALALDPKHFRANLLLGRILTLQGNAAPAIELLRTATSLQPASAEAYQFLADAYEKAGRAAEAAAARQRAQALTKKP
jgi:arylsulfatase A-like enzyme/Tfp pilus assembly protein PilF